MSDDNRIIEYFLYALYNIFMIKAIIYELVLYYARKKSIKSAKNAKNTPQKKLQYEMLETHL